MNVVRYEPWGLHRELLNHFFGRYNGDADESTAATAEWVPAVDIEEHTDKYVLHADVPGVDPSAIEITLEDGVLTLSGSRDKAVEQKDVDSRRVERATGRFVRRFTLPESVDAESVTAKGKHGVLDIVIPKRASAQPRKITVNA